MFQIQNNTEKHVSQATLKPSSLFSLIFSQSANQLKTLKAFISNELIELNNYAESSDKAKMYSFFEYSALTERLGRFKLNTLVAVG